MRKKFAFAAAGLASLIALPALSMPTGTPKAGAWSFDMTGGAEFVTGGDVHGGTNAPVANLGALNPALTGVSATLQIEPRSFNDVYGTLYGVRGAVSYGLDDNAETFFGLTYSWGSGDRLQVGGAAVPALNTTLPVYGDFGNFKAWGLEAGYRYFFDTGSNVHPYVAAKGTVQWVDKINATFTIPDANITLTDVRFYDSSTAWGAGLDVGFLWQAGPGLSVGVESGIAYAGKLKDDDRDIGGLGLAGINNEGDRWTIPLKATLRATF
jgi:hypothetical protein